MPELDFPAPDGRTTLLTPNFVYRPMRYGWAHEAWLTSEKMHWLHEEVPLADDVTDWHRNITPEERNLLTQIFRFFTQSDVAVGAVYNDIYARYFRPTEVRMMLTSFSNRESVHIAGYAALLDTVGMPEVEYSAFMQYREMREKFEYMQSFDGRTLGSLLLTMAVFGAFTEGLQLFASFAMLLNFPRFGKMRGMGQIVAWSVRDETLHCNNVIRLFRTLLSEYPEMDTPELWEEIRGACATVVAHEDAFIDLAFEMGPVRGLDRDQMKAYIRFVANRRLEQLGTGTMFDVPEHPIPWVDELMSAVEHVNFFENRGTEYSKAATTGQWADVWASVDARGEGAAA